MNGKILMAFTAILALSACKTTVDPGDVTVRGDGYQVDVGDEDRKFCPPGHAKKGWC